MRYLIDGCNFLIQRFGFFNQENREKFISLLKLFQNKNQCKIILFFDSREARCIQVEAIQKDFEVRYVPSPADNYIIRYLSESENRHKIIVVSDDKLHITEKAKQMGARAISTEEFLDILVRKHTVKISKKPEKPVKESEKEKKRYLDIWEEPESEIETDIDRYLKLWREREEMNNE